MSTSMKRSCLFKHAHSDKLAVKSSLVASFTEKTQLQLAATLSSASSAADPSIAGNIRWLQILSPPLNATQHTFLFRPLLPASSVKKCPAAPSQPLLSCFFSPSAYPMVSSAFLSLAEVVWEVLFCVWLGSLKRMVGD